MKATPILFALICASVPAEARSGPEATKSPDPPAFVNAAAPEQIEVVVPRYAERSLRTIAATLARDAVERRAVPGATLRLRHEGCASPVVHATIGLTPHGKSTLFAALDEYEAGPTSGPCGNSRPKIAFDTILAVALAPGQEWNVVATHLDQLHPTFAAHFPAETRVTEVAEDGRGALVIGALRAAPEPPSPKELLRRAIASARAAWEAGPRWWSCLAYPFLGACFGFLLVLRLRHYAQEWPDSYLFLVPGPGKWFRPAPLDLVSIVARCSLTGLVSTTVWLALSWGLWNSPPSAASLVWAPPLTTAGVVLTVGAAWFVLQRGIAHARRLRERALTWDHFDEGRMRAHAEAEPFSVLDQRNELLDWRTADDPLTAWAGRYVLGYGDRFADLVHRHARAPRFLLESAERAILAREGEADSRSQSDDPAETSRTAATSRTGPEHPLDVETTR